MGAFYSKKAVKTNWGKEGWRVFWEVPPYRAVSAGFTTLKKARGFKRYLWRAFKIKSRIKPMTVKLWQEHMQHKPK